MESLKNTIDRIRLYIEVTHISDIARRYFVKNGMDGSMTVLGIILGSWAARVKNPYVIVMAGLGACLAMGVSGLFGAYITEKAERKRIIKNLEIPYVNGHDLFDSFHHVDVEIFINMGLIYRFNNSYFRHALRVGPISRTHSKRKNVALRASDGSSRSYHSIRGLRAGRILAASPKRKYHP